MGKACRLRFTEGIMYNTYGYSLRTFRMVDSIQLHKGWQGDFESF